MINPPRHQIRSFQGMLPDVQNMAVVSRSKRSLGPTPEELAEVACAEARRHGQIEGYMEGLNTGRLEGLEQGRQEAYEQVYRETKAQAKREVDELMAVLAAHIAEVNAEIPLWFERAEKKMRERTMAILKRMLAAELELDHEHALAIVKDALTEVTNSSHVRIRMNPFDSLVVSQHRDVLMALTPQLRDIAFVDDPSIEGGCIIESEGGIVDARISTKLEMIDGDLAA